MIGIVCSLGFLFNSSSLVEQVKKNNPFVSYDHAANVACAAKVAGDEHGVDAKEILSLMMIESSYYPGTFNRGSYDYGIGQVNIHNVNAFDLDPLRLMFDLRYSVGHTARIYKWFRKRYNRRNAVSRYNCGTRAGCVEWTSVRKYYKKFLKYM